MTKKNSTIYNNGTEQHYFSEGDIIPEGYIKGKIKKPLTEAQIIGHRKSVETQKKNWASKSEEEIANWKNKCSEAQKNRSQESWDSWRNSVLGYHSNLSEAEKIAINKKRSSSLKQNWANKSQEEKELITKHRKDNGAGWNHKTIINTNLEKYGVENQFIRTDVNWNYNHKDSAANLAFAHLLDENNIKYEREFPIKNRAYDFKVNNILIEIDPWATHNSTWSPFGESDIQPINYHVEKSELALNNNFRCIHIFDWDDIYKIINLLKPRKKLYARNCIIKEVDLNTAREYLNQYHLQNYAKDDIRIGLYNNDELVSIMTFGKPRYNKNFQYELIRYCSNYYVIGGEEKLFKYFIKTYNPNSIISYCDRAKFEGNIYTKLNFKLINNVKPSLHWYNGKKHITDNLLRQRGFDQLFGTSYGKGTNNEELMLKNKFVKIYDCGQSRYEWYKEDLN